MSNTNTAAPVRQLDVSSRSLIVSDSFRDSKRKLTLQLHEGYTWEKLQHTLATTRGLPIKDTGSGKSQHTLLNQARSQGFQLEVLVPPFLHKLSFEEEIWDVGDAEAWDHLLSFLPSSNDEAANLLLDDCFNKYSNAKPFTKVLEGCHGVWEMAIMCTEQDIGQIFTDAHIKLMVTDLGSAFKGTPSERVCKSTKGCHFAAAMWWLLTKPKAQVCPVRAKDGTILGEESSDEEEGFSLYKKVKRLPSSKSVLHSLLKSKLMPTAAALLREMSRMTKGKGAEKLRYGARMKHTALMAAWATEIMRYALGITFVKNTMKNVCASFFDSHHPGGAAFFRSSDGGRISATIVISGSGSKAAAKGIKGEDEEQSAPRPYQLERDLVGIEPEVLWSTLLHAAAIPAWLCADIKPEYEVAPVAYEAATRTIQNQWRTMVAKVEIAKLKEQMKNVMARDKKSLLSRNNGKTISDADRDAWSQAVAMAEAKELSGLDAVMAGLKNYFDFQHQTCPSVAAVECLLSTVLDCPQQQEHFLQHAELPLLLNLLQESLPLRTQHLACVLLSLFFRTKARCGVAAWLPGGRTTDVSSVHDLLPRLVHVTAIEPAEQEFRYGDWQRTHTDHPTKILGAYQPPLLKEVRCSAHGSEISVHAATCVWGSGKLLAAEALMAFRKAQALYLKGALDPEAQLAEAMAEASTAYLNKFDKAVESLLKMVHTGVYNRRGPAAHILAASLPAMAYQKETIPTLIKLGLIDRGDNKDGEHALGRGRSSRKGKQLQHSVSREGDGAPYAAKWGITSHRAGLVGVLVDSEVPAHALCAGACLALITTAYSTSAALPEAAKKVLIKDNWTRRVLEAGAWPNLVSCLAVLPECTELQQVVAIAMMHLAEELATKYDEIQLEHEISLRQSRSGSRSRSPRREPRHADGMDSAPPSPRRILEPSVSVKFNMTPAVSLSQLPLESPNGLTPRLLRWNSLTKPPGILIRDAGETEGMDMGPDLHRVFRLLLHGRFDSTEEAVKVLAQLLKSRDMSVVQCAAMATFHLASIPTLKEPLGVVGVVESLVTYIRRWVDLFSASDQHDERHACEWVMTALEKLMQEPGGSNNVQRFSQCWKKMEDKREGDILEMNGFGYLMDVVPGQVPGKMGETEMELIERTMWSGFGWGRGQVVAPAGSDPTLKASRAPLKRGSHSSSSGGALKGKAGEAAAKGASSSDSSPEKVKDVRSAVDPVELLVQVVDTHSKRKTSLLNIKLPALVILRVVSREMDMRMRLVSAGAGSQLAKVAQSSSYDSKTRAAASALWLEIMETPEGQDPRWWAAMQEAAPEERRSSITSMSTSTSTEASGEQQIEAQTMMQMKMLRSGEPDQEAVGSRAAAGLMCKGDAAKRIFYSEGGLTALLDVASHPKVELRVLAPTCIALLNLSSYVPVQVEMCARALRLLLHINSRFSAFNGYTGEVESKKLQEGIIAKAALSDFLTPFFEVAKKKAQPEAQVWHKLVKDVLFGTSGALNNLSRHPDNHNMLYRLELEVKTRQAVADIMDETGANILHTVEGAVDGAPPRIPTTHIPPPKLTSHILNEAEFEVLKTIVDKPLFSKEVPVSKARSVADTEDIVTEKSYTYSHQSRGALSTMSSHHPHSHYAPSVAGGSSKYPDEKSTAWDLNLKEHHGNGASGQMPALYALRHNLAQPASTMWAPILVDKHDGPAPVLFDVVHRSTDNHDLVSSRASGALGSPHLVSNSPTARLMSSGGAVPGSPSSRAAAPMKAGMGMVHKSRPLRATSAGGDGPLVIHKRGPNSSRWAPSVQSISSLPARASTNNMRASLDSKLAGSSRSRPQTTYSDQSSSEREVRITFESIHRNSARVPNFRPASAEHGQQRKWLGGSHLTSETDLSGAHSVTASQDSTFKTPASHALSMVEQLNQLMGRSGLSSPTPSGPNSPQHERPKSSEPSAVPSLLTSQSVERHVTFGGGTNQSAKASHRMSRASKGRFGTISVSLDSGAHNEHRNGSPQPNPSPSRASAPMKIIALEKEASLANKEAGIRKKQMEAAEANRAQVISDFQAPKVAMWASHQGSKIYEDLFPSFGLPDGSNAYMYRHRKTRVDEVQLFVPELGYDENLNSAVAPPTEGVQSVIKDILRKLTELPIEGRYPVMKDMGYPPRPAICALPDLGYLSNLKSLVKAKEDAPGEERDFSLMPQFRSWEHEHGRVRRKASAVGKTKSHQPHSSSGVLQNPSEGLRTKHEPSGATALSFADGIFDCDWNSCSDKSRYNTMISKAVGKDPSGELLEDLKHQLRTRYAGVVHVFDYYAALHSDSFSMGLVTWGQFAMEAGIADDTSPSCKLADLDRIFLIANFEEDKTTESADANPDKALMRFEFLEALIRTAYAKYLEKRPGKGKKKLKPAAPPPPANPRAAKKAAEAALEAEKSEADAGYDPDTPPKTLSEACIKLIDRCIMPHAPPESLMDKRMFRGERMYTMDVDILLQHNRKILEAIFNHYKNLFAQSDSKRLDMPEWLELMHDCSLFHRYFNQREAKIAFVWSRLRYYDEVTSKRSYQLSRSLSFIEFLEALGRIADMISFPPPDELVEGGYDPEHPTWDYIKQAVDNDAYYKDRESAGFTAPKSRPLDVKLEQVVEVMLRSLMFKFGARDMEQLKIKLKAQRSRAYQMGKSTM